MNLDNENLKWKLCEAYFSILEISMSSEVSIDKLCIEAKLSIEEVEKIVPNNSWIIEYFSLKFLYQNLIEKY